MGIPFQSLRDLPPGASFSKKDGQANINIAAKGDSLIIEATCDSLLRQCEYYYGELTRIRDDTQSEYKEETKIRSPVKVFVSAFVMGILIGLLLRILINNIRKRWL